MKTHIFKLYCFTFVVKMFEKKWIERKPKLNRKVVIRLPENLYQQLLSYLESNPKFFSVSSFVRSLIVDQLSGRTDTGQEKTT
ncbi:MAG: hypothetical protein QXS37_03165 [Candidatus Aenigmatarchaeota archaeon]